MDGITWPSVLTSIASPEPISGEMAAWAMREVFRNQATEAQTSAFIFGLKTRGETPEQVSALATVMLEFANLVPELPHKRVIFINRNILSSPVHLRGRSVYHSLDPIDLAGFEDV